MKSQNLKEGFEVVTKLLKHITYLLNIELYLFFEQSIPKFDPSEGKIFKANEYSHEQFLVYKEFERLISESLGRFVETNGYKSVSQLYTLIEKAVVIDKKLHKEKLEKLLSRMKSLNLVETRSDSRGSKGNANENSLELMRNACHMPCTMESLVKTLLELTTYDTFIKIMKTKVCHKTSIDRILRLERLSKPERKLVSKSLHKAKHTESVDSLLFCFQNLKKRMINLLPQSITEESEHPFKALLEKALDENLLEEALVEDNKDSGVGIILKGYQFIQMLTNSEVLQDIYRDCKRSEDSLYRRHSSTKSLSLYLENSTESSSMESYKTEEDTIFTFCLESVATLLKFVDRIEDFLFDQVNKQKEHRETIVSQIKEFAQEDSETNTAEERLFDDFEGKQSTHKESKSLF